MNPSGSDVALLSPHYKQTLTLQKEIGETKQVESSLVLSIIVQSLLFYQQTRYFAFNENILTWRFCFCIPLVQNETFHPKNHTERYTATVDPESSR